MKYKAKVACPGYKKGSVTDSEENLSEKYPDVFHEIKDFVVKAECGTKIYEGDKCWIITNNKVHEAIAGENNNLSKVKVFATPENAKEFIENNIPKFSTLQINDALEKSVSENTDLISIAQFRFFLGV